jgi:hypothetical protein
MEGSILVNMGNKAFQVEIGYFETVVRNILK